MSDSETAMPTVGPGSTGAGSTGAGSTGAGSTGAGSTGAGSTGAGSTGAGATETSSAQDTTSGPDLMGDRVDGVFPTDPNDWTFVADVGLATALHRPMGVTYDSATSLWHLMGREWGDGVSQLLYTSPNGLDTWTEAPGNPLIVYDESIPKTDSDWYAQMPNYGRYPDSSMKKIDGRWVVVIVNFDGTDSDLQWLTSADGFVWDQRGDTGIDIGPAGSEDRGEQWPTTLVFNPDDALWYLYYHGGGSFGTGSGRTIGVASGPSPMMLSEHEQSFEDGGLITQNPLVLRDQTGWIMVYQHGFNEGDGIWYARSENLLDWTTQGQILQSASVGLLNWAVVANGDGGLLWRIYVSIDGNNGVYEAVVQ